jgi:hypothetical protein
MSNLGAKNKKLEKLTLTNLIFTFSSFNQYIKDTQVLSFFSLENRPRIARI